MKTKIIKGKVDILLVDGLPKEARDFKYFNDKENPYMSYKLGVVVEREYAFPQGNWKFISTIENLSEIEADGLVERQASDIKIYLNYNKMRFKIGMKAIESFQSLLQANDENNEFNPKTTLIFIKSN